MGDNVFLKSFGLNFVFVASYDTCWWAINYRYAGVIYPKREKSTKKTAVLVTSRAILWMVYAAFLGFFGWLSDGKIDAAIFISAAFGVGAFSFMNCATFPVDTEWRIWPTAIIDTLWGTVLMGASYTTAALILQRT